MITTEQLILAWRKAKVYLYYSSNLPLIEMADYESKLMENLQNLLDRINDIDKSWTAEKIFLGSWTHPTKFLSPHRKDNYLRGAH